MDDVIDFYYFSGTGNTLLVVKKMCDTFEENGIKVNVHKIEDSDPDKINLEHTIGIAFPVAVLSTYPFVWDFIHGLPEANGTELFMVDTLGGYSGGLIGPMKRIIEKRGYDPIGAKEIIMPSNALYIEDKNTCQKKIERGLIEAEKYALNVINNDINWSRVPVFSDAMYIVSTGLLRLAETELNQKWFNFKVDNAKCSKCGICVNLCPLKNIEMDDGNYPEHLHNCQYCVRCVSFCPKKAMNYFLSYKGKTYHAVKAKEFLNKEENLLERDIKIAIEVKD